MSSVASRLAKGSMWISLSRAIVNGLAALSTIVLAWYLAPADFGLVALGMTMLAIAKSVTDLSLNQALIRHEKLLESHLSTAWTLNATRGILLCLFFAACAYPVSALYEEPRLLEVMLALGLSVLISGLSNPRLVVLQRKLIFRQEFVLRVAERLTTVTTSVTLAIIYQSYWALVLGALAGQVVMVGLSYLMLPFRPRITFRHVRELFSFSAWLTAGQIVNTLNWRFDYLLIGKVLGATALGYYTVGSHLARTPTREATLPLTQTIYPSFANIRSDPRRLASAYQRAQALVSAIALPAGIGVALIADPLVRLLMGERWAPAIFIIQALASVYALQTLGSLVQPLGMAKGETRLLFVRDTQMLIVRVPIIFVGMVLYGLPGVIYCRVFTGLLGALVNMFLVQRLIGVTVLKQLAANGRALASIAMMAAGVAFASSYLPYTTDKGELAQQLALQVALGGVLYCSSTLLLWVLMRRPSGPETDIQKLLGEVLSRVRSAKPA